MLERLTSITTVTLAILLATVVTAGAEGITGAVIVGVSDYKYINDLNYAAKDARDIYNKTLEMTNTKKSNIKLLAGRTATKKKIKSMIKVVGKKVAPGDVFMFFFSGHGSFGDDIEPYDDNGNTDEYLCPYKTKGDVVSSMIRDDELYEWLLPITQRGAKVLVILDTCYSGGAFKSAAVNGKPGVTVKVMDGTPVQKPESKDSGFVKDLNSSGFIVMTASDDTEESTEWRWFQNGVFTHLLLRALDGGADDTYVIDGIGDDGSDITANELFHAATVIENVAYKDASHTKTSYFEQTPQIYLSDANDGDITLFLLK